MNGKAYNNGLPIMIFYQPIRTSLKLVQHCEIQEMSR